MSRFNAGTAVVDITGDSKGLRNASSRAMKTLDGLAKRMRRVALVGATMFAGLATVAIKAFGTQQDAIASLETALIIAGDAAASTSESFQRFASELQKVTTIGDETTIKLGSLIATLTNLSGKALEDATRTTLGLARATGQGAEMMARAFAVAKEGEFTMLQRYIPALRGTNDETEKMRLVNEFAAKGLLLLEADAKTLVGTLQQLKNAVGDALEVIGEQLAPAVTRAAESLKQIVPVMAEFVKQNGEAIVRAIKWTAAIGGALIVLPKLIAAIAGVVKIMTTLIATTKTLLAFSGPKGWAILATGVGVAAAATAAAKDSMDRFKDSIADAISESERMAKENEKLAKSFEDVSEASGKAREQNRRINARVDEEFFDRERASDRRRRLGIDTSKEDADIREDKRSRRFELVVQEFEKNATANFERQQKAVFGKAVGDAVSEAFDKFADITDRFQEFAKTAELKPEPKPKPEPEPEPEPEPVKGLAQFTGLVEGFRRLQTQVIGGDIPRQQLNAQNKTNQKLDDARKATADGFRMLADVVRQTGGVGTVSVFG